MVGRVCQRHFSQGCRVLCESKQQDAPKDHKKEDFDFQENIQADRDAETDHRERLKEADAEATFNAKQRILKASLNFVPDHGWTYKTLAAGAEAEGLPQVAHGMFPRGGVELAEFFYSMSNEELAEILAAEVEEAKESDTGKKSTSTFIRDAVEVRLRMLIPHLDSWPQAMALMSLPQNAGNALRNLGTLVDHIWFYAGDRSLDTNWYTKRVTLAGIYKSSELYMLQDHSEDFENTWEFLDRRMSDMSKVGKCVRQAKNVLGMNGRNR